jgi:hypothetical protein
MAKQPVAKKADSVSSIDPDKMYRVKMRRAVKMGKFGEMMLSPRGDNMVKGYILASLSSDDYVSYEVA